MSFLEDIGPMYSCQYVSTIIPIQQSAIETFTFCKIIPEKSMTMTK